MSIWNSQAMLTITCLHIRDQVFSVRVPQILNFLFLQLFGASMNSGEFFQRNWFPRSTCGQLSILLLRKTESILLYCKLLSPGRFCSWYEILDAAENMNSKDFPRTPLNFSYIHHTRNVPIYIYPYQACATFQPSLYEMIQELFPIPSAYFQKKIRK